MSFLALPAALARASFWVIITSLAFTTDKQFFVKGKHGKHTMDEMPEIQLPLDPPSSVPEQVDNGEALRGIIILVFESPCFDFRSTLLLESHQTSCQSHGSLKKTRAPTRLLFDTVSRTHLYRTSLRVITTRLVQKPLYFFDLAEEPAIYSAPPRS